MNKKMKFLGIVIMVFGLFFALNQTKAVNNLFSDYLVSDGSDIYYLSAGKRHIVPSSNYIEYRNAIVASWGWSDSDIKIVSSSVLLDYEMGGYIGIKPNSRYLLKRGDDKYFIVSSTGALTEVDKNNYSNFTLVTPPDVYFAGYGALPVISGVLNSGNPFLPDIIPIEKIDATVGKSGDSNYYSSSNINLKYFYVGDHIDIITANYKNNGGQMVTTSSNPFKTNLKITKNGETFLDSTVSSSNLSGGVGTVGIWSWAPTQAGVYDITITLDVDSEISESNENNNILKGTIKISNINEPLTQYPVGFSVPEGVTPSESGLNYLVFNWNGGHGPWISNMYSYVDSGIYYSTNKACLENLSCASVKRGVVSGFYYWSLRLDNLQPGTLYYYKIYADGKTSENIMQASTISSLKDKPDLIIKDFYYTSPSNIKIIVENTNKTNKVKEFSFFTQVLDLDSNQQGKTIVSYSDSENNQFFNIPFDTKCLDCSSNFFDFSNGSHRLQVTVDSAGDISESNESNNVFTKNITIGDASIPIISNIQISSIGPNSVVIDWDTNVETSSLVWSKEKIPTWAWQGTDDLSKHHSVLIPHLQPLTTYPYIIDTTDAKGNRVTSEIKEFTTMSLVSDTIVITNLKVDDSTIRPDKATVSWDTNIDTNSIVSYIETNQIGINNSWMWQGSDDFSKKHSVLLPNLKSFTIYSYYVNAKDASGNIVKSETKEFTTTLNSEKTISTEKPVKRTDEEQIKQIVNNANRLHDNNLDDILSELKQLRDTVKEQASKIKYLELVSI